MSNWAGKLVSMCLCKGTELLAIARSRILFPIGRLALFEGGGTPGVASDFWIPAHQEPPLRNQVTALRAHLLASSLETQDEEPCTDGRPD